jgi:hypothetical protein|tara:strand:+ start:907 stop:1023 length:117 start_codon:yes stop_codon:yes gene_type:complete
MKNRRSDFCAKRETPTGSEAGQRDVVVLPAGVEDISWQ